MSRFLCLTGCLLFFLTGDVFSQQTPYILNGAATQRTCNCYVLTEDVRQTSGTVWNKNKIDLRESFDYVFDINLGCKDNNGADGIGFILQTQGTNLGATGQGIGFKGISPSVGVIIDTWQNTNENDPPGDHVAIQINGVTDHARPENLVGPISPLPNSDNIEDCNWHLFRIRWDAVKHDLEVFIDGNSRLLVQVDMVADVFSSDPWVYWGFAGATGGSSNLQQFCAALRPGYSFDNGQVLCDGTPIVFRDDASSFGVITRYYWDLGDGTIFTGKEPGSHLYPKAGIYDVKQVIEDNSGCISDTIKSRVTVGSWPDAKFTHGQLCLGGPMILEDASQVTVGTLESWRWDFGNGQTSTQQKPQLPFTAPGVYPVELEVVSREGCSGKITQQVTVHETPRIRATAPSVCLGEAVDFDGANLTPALNIRQWYWKIGEQDTLFSRDPSHIYPKGGEYEATLHAVSDAGCMAEETISLIVRDLQLDAGRDTIIARNQPLRLEAIAEGKGLQFAWWPATGLDDPYSASPIATLVRDQPYRVRVTSPEGCWQEDELMVKVYEGPEFHVPNAFSPNGDGLNDRFRVIAAGVPAIDFFMIWDRWGTETFHTKALPAVWDGMLRGKPAPPGTYVWMVQGVDYKGRRFSRQGTVTLIR
ncbi:lectin-like domain-containing protein [Chitinophaga lutea]